MIRLTNLNRQYQDLFDLLYEAQDSVINSGQVMLGRWTEQLEEYIAERSGAKYCAVVGSGSDALMYGLIASDVASVTIPAQTFVATQNSCVRANCHVQYADVDAQGCIKWGNVISDSAVWVGLFGNPSTVPTDRTVYEDGAQHFGLPLQGVFASYSFDPTKTLPNYGNGGAVVSNDQDLIEHVKHLRRHGKHAKHVGGNSIMSERDCAELCAKLEYFDDWTRHRQELALYYQHVLRDYVDIVTDPKGMVSKFVIATDRKACLRTHLQLNKIQCKDVYAQPIFDMPQAKHNCETFLSIPCDSYTTDDEVELVVDAIKMFFEPSPFKT